MRTCRSVNLLFLGCLFAVISHLNLYKKATIAEWVYYGRLELPTKLTSYCKKCNKVDHGRFIFASDRDRKEISVDRPQTWKSRLFCYPPIVIEIVAIAVIFIHAYGHHYFLTKW